MENLEDEYRSTEKLLGGGFQKCQKLMPKVWAKQMKIRFSVLTYNGRFYGDPMDYLVKDNDGVFHVIRRDDFETEYRWLPQ